MDGTGKKITRLAVIGFLIGIVIGNLISVCTSPGSWPASVSGTLIRKAGSVTGAVILQNLVCGLLGAVSMSGSIFYDFEDWPMTKCAVLHCLLILAAYFPAAFFCGWIEPKREDILLMAGIMTAAYLLVWLVMYLRCRKEADELNREVRKKQGSAAAVCPGKSGSRKQGTESPFK